MLAQRCVRQYHQAWCRLDSLAQRALHMAPPRIALLACRDFWAASKFINVSKPSAFIMHKLKGAYNDLPPGGAMPPRNASAPEREHHQHAARASCAGHRSTARCRERSPRAAKCDHQRSFAPEPPPRGSRTAVHTPTQRRSPDKAATYSKRRRCGDVSAARRDNSRSPNIHHWGGDSSAETSRDHSSERNAADRCQVNASFSAAAPPKLYQLAAHVRQLVHYVVDESQGGVDLQHFDDTVCSKLAALPADVAETALTRLADRSVSIEGADMLAELADELDGIKDYG